MSNKNIFSREIYTGPGNSIRPAYSYYGDESTGTFHTGNGVGITSKGSVIGVFNSDIIDLKSNLRFSKNPIENSVLLGDAQGNASWTDFPVKSGQFVLNSLFKDIDITKDNNEVEIIFDKPMKTNPSVSLTKESDLPNLSPNFYIKNKTNEKFTLYFDKPLSKNVVNGEFGSYSFVKLENDEIGVCYYDYVEDRLYYKYSTENRTIFSEPIMVDDISIADIVDMIIVNGKPAILYIADNGDNDEWRYIRSADENGSVWEGTITLLTSQTSVNFIPLSLNMVVNSESKPMIILNNETGRAQIIISDNEDGSSWGTPINISNLTNHQILSAKIIDEYLHIVAKSNQFDTIYHVKANNKQSTSWPVGATQLFAQDSTYFKINQGECSCDIGMINGVLSIIASEKSTNKLCISKLQEESWSNFECLVETNTFAAYPTIFENSGRYYVIYNDYSGTPSQKNLIEFQDDEIKVTENFSVSLILAKENKVVKNKNNNIMLLSSQNNLTMVDFYGNDYKINWMAL